MRLARLCAVLLSLALPATPVLCRAWYVNPEGHGDAPTIQAGIDSAATADTILLSDGTYVGPGNFNISYLGKAIIVRPESGNRDHCIIDCQQLGRAFFFGSGEDSTSILESVTITNGGATTRGAGVYCSAASPKFVDCVFSFNVGSNTPYSWGGAMYCSNASPIVDSCSFIQNRAYVGGGINCGGPSFLRIRDCNFEDNRGDHAGGAVFASGTVLAMEGSTFVGNNTNSEGGALSIRSGCSGSIQDCAFDENWSYRNGGAVNLGENAPAVVFSGCVFSRNRGDLGNDGYFGGAVNSDRSYPIFTECVFMENSAGIGGAALCGCFGCDSLYSQAPMFTSCLFLWNEARTAGGGGALYSRFCSFPSVTACTFFGNAATAGRGGGIVAAERGRVTVESTVIAHGSSGEAVWCDSLSAVTLTCSDLYGNAGGDWIGCIAGQYGLNGNFSEDPLFCDPGSGNLMLDAASPCLNAPGCGLVGACGQGCDVVTAVGPGEACAPRRYSLGQNVPNPFNPTTTISFSIPVAGPVSLTVHDITGRLVATLADGVHQPGEFTAVWDGKDDSGADAPSGFYFARLQAGDFTATRKLVLIR